MQAAGEARLRIILQKQYNSVGCFYCRKGSTNNPSASGIADTHTYHNCPNRPCCLCKKPGHVTSDCPFRTTPQRTAAQKASIQALRNDDVHPCAFLKRRELSSRSVQLPFIPPHRAYLSAHCSYISYNLHRKRITAADWHPDGQAILSADKEGSVHIWPVASALSRGNFNSEKLEKHSLMLMPNRCNINAFAFDAAKQHSAYLSSSDGTVTEIDMNNASNSRSDGGGDMIMDFNPNGWNGKASFIMAYGLTYDDHRRTLYIGLTDGSIARVDPRARSPTDSLQLRARFHSNKVTTVQVNPTGPDLICTASNDNTVRLWDARKMLPDHYLGSFLHDKIVSSAYFSPNSGAKLLTTSTDNRIRVWNDVHAFRGDVNAFADTQPIEMIHSHDFYRYLSPFRAVWDPKDWNDDLFMCGRFLGEAYVGPGQDEAKAKVLHPIDLFSCRSASVVHSLVDSSIPLICTINKFCPVANVVLTAASRNLYLWTVPPVGQPDSAHLPRPAPGGGPDGDDADRRGDDDDDAGDGGGGGGGSGGSTGKKRKFNSTMTVTRKSLRSSAGRRGANH